VEVIKGVWLQRTSYRGPATAAAFPPLSLFAPSTLRTHIFRVHGLVVKKLSPGTWSETTLIGKPCKPTNLGYKGNNGLEWSYNGFSPSQSQREKGWFVCLLQEKQFHILSSNVVKMKSILKSTFPSKGTKEHAFRPGHHASHICHRSCCGFANNRFQLLGYELSTENEERSKAHAYLVPSPGT